MRNFFSCISKDLRIFGRSKVSALVTIVVPLLVVLFIGFAFSSTSLQGVNVGVYSASYSELTNSLLKSFEEQSYSITKINSQDECVNSVKLAKTQICVIFPQGLSDTGSEQPIVFYVDNSRVNIAYTLLDSVKSKVSVKSSEIGSGLVEEIINKMQNAKKTLTEQKVNVDSAAAGTSEIELNSNKASSSIPDLAGLSVMLDDAKNLSAKLNTSDSNVVSLKSKLDSVSSQLNSVKSSFSGVSSNINDIKTASGEAKRDLDEVSKKIDDVILELGSLKTTDAGEIVSPIKTEINPISAGLKNSDFLFPTLLALSVLFGSVMLSSTIVLKEKKTKAYFRNFITPTSDFTFFIAMFFSSLIILIVQLAVLFAGLFLIDKVHMMSYLPQISLILLLSATTFILMGMLIGYIFRSEETALLISISVISLLLFFSNTILPIETVSGTLQKYVGYNPLVVADSMLKKTILFGVGLGSMMDEIYVLIVASLVLFVFAFFAKRLTKRML